MAGTPLGMIVDRVGNLTDRKALQCFASATDAPSAKRPAITIQSHGPDVCDPKFRTGSDCLLGAGIKQLTDEGSANSYSRRCRRCPKPRRS
jgi:hypothetical protein